MKQLVSPGPRADSPHSDLNALLHPARAFARPCDLVTEPNLTRNEKGAILASWASDACAVEAAPALRCAPGSERPVSIDAILEAVGELEKALAGTSGAALPRQTRRRSTEGFRSVQPPAGNHSGKALSR